MTHSADVRSLGRSGLRGISVYSLESAVNAFVFMRWGVLRVSAESCTTEMHPTGLAGCLDLASSQRSFL